MSTIPCTTTNSRLQGIFLALGAMVISALWLITHNVTFTSDSTTYFQYAQWLVGQTSISPIWYLRLPGFPVLLNLTGVTIFNTFAGYIIFQGLVSVGIVLIIRNIVGLFAPAVAILSGWLSIACFIPFIFSNTVMTEHVNIFLHLLLIYLLSAFALKQQLRLVILASIVSMVLFLLRPSNMFLFIITILFVGYYSQTAKLKNTTLAILIIGSIFVSYAIGYSLLKMSHPGLEGMSSVFQGVRAILYEPYMDGAIAAQNGKASNSVITAVNDYVGNLSVENLKSRKPQQLFTPYLHRNTQLATAIFSNPNPYYYNLLTEAAADNLGRNAASKLLSSAAIEAMLAKPEYIWRFGKNILQNSSRSYTGQLLLYQLMLKAQYIGVDENSKPSSKINPSNGPATAELITHVNNYINTQADKWSLMDPDLFAKYKDHPEQLMQQIWQQPNHVYHWFIWQALDRELDPVRAAKIFSAAAVEGYKAHPYVAISYLDDIITYFLGPDVTYKSGTRIVSLPDPAISEKNYSGLSPAMQAEVAKPWLTGWESFWDKLILPYRWLWLCMKPLLFCLSIASVPILFRTRVFPLCALVWGVNVYNATVVCVFADPIFRYSSVSWLLMLLLVMVAFLVKPTSQQSRSR